MFNAEPKRGADSLWPDQPEEAGDRQIRVYHRISFNLAEFRPGMLGFTPLEIHIIEFGHDVGGTDDPRELVDDLEIISRLIRLYELFPVEHAEP